MRRGIKFDPNPSLFNLYILEHNFTYRVKLYYLQNYPTLLFFIHIYLSY